MYFCRRNYVKPIRKNMFKNEILDALKAKFTGVSEKILGRVADNLAKTVTKAEDVQTAVDGVTFQQVLDSYGDSRATDATKTAVLNYEKKHGLKDGKSVAAEDNKNHDQENNPVENEDLPPYVKAMVASINKLSETVATMQGQELSKSRKQKLDEIIAPLSELQRKGYERINLKDLKDEEFETLLTEIQGEVGEITKTQGARGAVFGKPTVATAVSTTQKPATQQQEPSKEEVDAVMSHLKI